LSLLIAMTLLSPLPGRAQDNGAPEDEGVDPANEPYAKPAPFDPPTAKERLPVIDLSELPGLWPEDVVEAFPAKRDPMSPGEATEGTELLPKEGDATTDVYGTGDASAEHVALIGAEPRNTLDANGNWVDADPSLEAVAGGWTWTDATGVRFTFPAELSAATPVRVETGDRMLAIVPSGLAPSETDESGSSSAGVAGVADGTSVTYPGAVGGHDLVYIVTPLGVQEQIVLSKAPQDPTFRFTVTTEGLSLAHNPYGGLNVTATDGEDVGTIPAAVAYDSSKEIASSTAAFELKPLDGATELALGFDPSFFESATYPVVVDPVYNHDLSPHRDGYVQQSTPSTNYESDIYLKVDSGQRTFLRFDMAGVANNDRLVYDASLFLYPGGAGGVQGGIAARRPTQALPAAGTLNWNNQPSVASNDLAVVNASNEPNGWWSWQLKELFQHIIDPTNQWNTHWDNNGVRLSASNNKTFYSVNASGTADPVLYLSWNDLPPAFNLETPATNYVTETESLTLKAASIPNDPNGDDVLLSFQISDDGQSWSGTHLVFQSPYDDRRSFTVPAGVLTDGQDYWWRGVARDVCVQPNGLCSLNDGAGTTHTANTSGTRKFTVSLKHHGDDPRYAMWFHDVGSGMTLKVNEANGNLFLDVPLDSYATPVGPLEVGLTYNHQATADYGLSPGWDVAIGPRSGHSTLPIALYKLGTDAGADVKIRLRGGRVLYFPYQDKNVYGATSANSGSVRKAPTNWVYVDADGGRYIFALGAENAEGAHLTKAKPAVSQDAAPGKSIDYTYNGSGQLTTAVDPLGRKVVLGWSSGKLTTVTATGGTAATSFGEQVWTVGYDGSGRLATIDTVVSIPGSASRTEGLGFLYTSSKLSEVRDGVTDSLGATGWAIGYLTDANGLARVASITAPPGGSPSSAPTPWLFNYRSPFKGTTASGACITDPRGTGTDCDLETASDPAFQTQVEFYWSGLPKEIYSPPDVDGVRHLTTYAFDNHLNLLCERDPVANAWGDKHCTTATDANGNYTDLDPDGLSTLYTYSGEAPYRLKTVKQPAPQSGAPRLQESYAYDEGYSGLWAEIYDVETLADLPNDQYMWGDLDQDWAGGNPPGAGGTDTFSIRLTGYLEVADWTGPRIARFRVWSEDGVSLSVAGANILDCFGQQEVDTDYNCGSNNDVKKKITPPGSDLVPFEIEFSHLTGNASLVLKWDNGDGGSFGVPPATRFQPNLGLVTTKTYQSVGGTTTSLWEETWTYPTDDLKTRRLPEVHSRRDLPTGPEYETRTTYNTYGQPLTVTEHYGTSEAATTTNVWTNATPAWDTGKVSCLTQTTDPTGAVTRFECNRAGVTTKRIVEVRAQGPQPAQTRTTTIAHDSLGRPVAATGPSTEDTLSSYDLGGRLKQTKLEITSGVYAETDLTYDHAGHLMTETLPDPDRTGPLPRPVIAHVWDWADLEKSVTDARGKTWSTDHDALSRVTSQTSPLDADSTTTYLMGLTENRVVQDAPSGASIVTDLDILGRKVSEKLEEYAPTTFTYDVLNNQTQLQDPAGIVTKQNFNDLSELTSTVEFFGTPSAATTAYAYDVAGRLQQVDGPRSSPPDDRITYDYDAVGRSISSTYEGVTLPSSVTKASASITYDDAGERVRVSQPLTTSTTMTRDWTYDVSGQTATSADARGTTTFTYNLAGWPIQVDDPRPSLAVSMGYDDLGRRICRHTATCTQTTTAAETYAYDAAGNMTQAKNPNVTFDVSYDDDGRLWKTFRDGSGTPETTFTYDATTGRLTSIADAAGATAFTYNPADQLLTVDDPFVTGTPVSTYAYHATTGRLTTRTDAQANLRWERTYEANTGRLDTQLIKNDSSGVTLASFDLGYDPAGNVTSKASSVFSNPANGTWGYTYDGASRLTQATGPNASGASTTYNYAYDGGGNRILDKETTGTVVKNLTTTYDGTGLPTSASDAATGETFTYAHDQIGNLTGADSSIAANDWTYAYDPYSRLTCAVQGTSCASGSTRVLFAMDAIDRALTRTKGSSLTSLTYQGIAESVVKKVEGSTTTTYANTGGGAPLAEKTGSTVSFYLRDTHGDVVGLASTGAANQGTFSFDPWGKSLATTGQTSFLGYQGDMTDPDTKQVDMGTRWYAAGLGRFTSRDVLFGDVIIPMSLNQLLYGGADPVSTYDPDGMCARPDFCPAPPGSSEAEKQAWYEKGAEVTGAQQGYAGASLDLYVYEVTHPNPPPPKLYAKAFKQLVRWADYGRRNIQTSLGHSRWMFADGMGHLDETIESAEKDYPGARISMGAYRYWNEQRWKPKVSGWQAAGVLAAAACPFGFFSCAFAAASLATTKTLVAFSDNLAAPEPFDWGKFGADATFNYVSAAAGVVPGLGHVWSAYCATRENCSSNEWNGSIW
jgi:RHS repeat-associated protein